jgi:dTDP-4-amino-4,6-dideoxygalactose transaminase
VWVRVPLLDLTEQYATIAQDVTRAVDSVVTSQRFILGPEVEALETELGAWLGAPYAVACASGTDALLLPLLALQAPSEAEVVVPTFTFFATAGAVWNAGLRPVFCDVDPQTFNVDVRSVESALTPSTRALIPVHLFGQLAPMQELKAVADGRGVFLLEDAAQAIGARDATSRAGTAGDAAAFSFFPSKNLGGFGDGGMITTSNEALAQHLLKLRVHGGVRTYHHEMVGTNSRLDALQAAVLRAKLPRLCAWTEARRANAALYDELLAPVEEVVTPVKRPGAAHVYNQYTLRVQRRDALKSFLETRGIDSAVYYPVPLHLQDCFRSLGYARGDFPVAERLSQEVLSLPIYPELGEHRIRYVAGAIRDFYGA